jgi:Tol biopolymer transport system component
MTARRTLWWLVLAAGISCATPHALEPPSEAWSGPGSAGVAVAAMPDEGHLAEMRQLTFGGENAEAYWSFDGAQLVLQSRVPPVACDRIYRMDLRTDARVNVADSPPTKIAVSNGKGATTCSYFLPGNQEVIFASTHLGGDGCPPRPDRSQGYVWAIYDSYDIYRAKVDGSGMRRLTETPGYDAEGTVCAKDGSIVFTSVRDGDLDLYRMDSDGKNVKRLTSTPGYDGGAFFNADCSKIVWRASRPAAGKELDDYKALLAQGLVRPSKLELYVANADGSEPMQITYLNAAAFAPFWHPSQKRILFSTNYGDPQGREFDIWAVNVDGSNLERITYAKGFDGFPMFSPDGRHLAFSSNRTTPAGSHDTNVFVARWVEEAARGTTAAGARDDMASAADRLISDVRWLADPAREGRGVGTAGLMAAGEYIERRFRVLGLVPAGELDGYRQGFSVTTGVKIEAGTALTMAGVAVARDAMTPVGYSASGEVKADLVFAGYGISAKEIGVDDYGKLNVKGRIVVVRRFVPEAPGAADATKFADRDAQRRYGDIRYKAWTAREKGARALIVVDQPLPPKPLPADWKPPAEATLPSLQSDSYADVGIPVVVVKRDAAAGVLGALTAPGKRAPVRAELTVTLTATKHDAFNVVGRLGAGAPAGKRLPGVVVLGAHYDHLGMGGRSSLTPEKNEPHLGADDNASGTAALLETARLLAARRAELKRDVLFIAFSGEETGVLGSSYYTKSPTRGTKITDVIAMLNMDMVGRMRDNRVTLLGGASAEEWQGLAEAACARSRISCIISGEGFGPSDQMPFYAAGVPVVQFFTGAHADYHKPSDDAAKINAAGAAQVAEAAAEMAREVDLRESRLTLHKVAAPAPRGDMRSFNASLGTVPDYAGPPGGAKGVLLAGVRPGGGADKGGLRRGDILVKLGDHQIGSVEELMYVLNASKPGETVSAVALREGKEIKLEVTFQESHRDAHRDSQRETQHPR